MNFDKIIWEKFIDNAIKFPNKIAVIDGRTKNYITYKRLKEEGIAYGSKISNLSINFLIIVGEPEIDQIPLILSCAYINTCFVPINQNQPLSNIESVISKLGPRILVGCHHELDIFKGIYKKIETPFDKLDLKWYLIDKREISIKLDNLFLLTHTSGTTGEPKAIVFTQRTKLKRTKQSIDLFNITSKDVVLSPTPLHHSLGQRHLFISLISGAMLIKIYPFNPEVWLKSIKEFNVTFAIPVATHLKVLQQFILDNPSNLRSLRCLVTSSSTVEKEFKTAILDNATFDFWEIYGMTETACATAVRYQKGLSTAHLGKAIKGSKFRIKNKDNKNIGEIEIYSDCLCDGYLYHNSLWDESLTSDGYFKSGDLGKEDNDGNLIYYGRSNESFESSGLIVYPGEIEKVILEIESIKECIAFGIKDSIFGNLISIAYVQNKNISKKDIIKYARSNLSKQYWPARIFKIDSMALLSNGKIDRLKMINELTKKALGN